MPHINVQEISMYYEVHGSGEPLIFIAGFGADHASWLGIADVFKDKFQVILMDNRGIGQTDTPDGPYSIHQMSEDIARLCEALSIRHAHFVGNSMGGMILQTLAYRYPALVKSAVISHCSTTARHVFGIYAEAQLALIKAKSPIEVILKASCSWIYSYRFLAQQRMLDPLIQMGLNHPYPFTIKGYEAQFAALKGFDSSEWIKAINIPVLILGSDQDLIVRKIETQSLAHQIPHASYYCFQDCGHLPHIEYPKQFIDTVLSFIQGVRP